MSILKITFTIYMQYLLKKAGALYMFLPVIGILYPEEPHHLFDKK